MNETGLDGVQAVVRRTIQEHWLLFLSEGILLLVLGLLAIILPTVATLAIELVIGWLLLISGLIGLFTTWRMRGAPGRGWSLLSAAVGIVAGVVLLRWPLSGTVSLTLVLILFFLMEGIASILFAIDHRRGASGRWGWMLASGVIDVVLAGLLLSGLPASAAWALGLLVGINLIFGGIALIGMALHARAVTPSPDVRGTSGGATANRV